jgi:hypothetical protein
MGGRIGGAEGACTGSTAAMVGTDAWENVSTTTNRGTKAALQADRQ